MFYRRVTAAGDHIGDNESLVIKWISVAIIVEDRNQRCQSPVDYLMHRKLSTEMSPRSSILVESEIGVIMPKVLRESEEAEMNFKWLPLTTVDS
ncbi:hypothetical protein SLEP1_g47901 [Rubroshorea leprosula]|uniref:Uncharacterized protein n=1 Tax=Rubroshorea leprosula TaxID=152421 RepID=A0AAV5LU01_9ROSI|nr:hypothetical protein SLEP1_g47901 [Rubroshorea leprosula]